MGNHEYPCQVCGENKFGLSGCDERSHTTEELKDARARRESHNQYTGVIDRILEERQGVKS